MNDLVGQKSRKRASVSHLDSIPENLKQTSNLGVMEMTTVRGIAPERKAGPGVRA
jgi:hypothetical protein